MAAPPPSAGRASPTPAPQVRRPQLPHPRRPGRVLVTGMAVVLLAALGPPARAEDPTSLDSVPTVQPPPDAATQPPTGLADSDLRGESDPAPDEPAAAGGWTLHLEAL